MRKSDIARSYHSGSRGRPMIDVKWYPYLPDIVRKFEGVTRYSRRLGRRHHVHEFGDDTKFWAWVHELDDIVDPYSHDDPFQVAEEIAREVGWERAQESAEYIWGTHAATRHKKVHGKYQWDGRDPITETYRKANATVYSEGRSGGWLVVDGIGDPDEWDLMDMNAWSRFNRDVRAIVDDLDYQLIWHLYVNVYEPDVVEPERRRAERGAEADAEMLDEIVQSTKEAA